MQAMGAVVLYNACAHRKRRQRGSADRAGGKSPGLSSRRCFLALGASVAGYSLFNYRRVARAYGKRRGLSQSCNDRPCGRRNTHPRREAHRSLSSARWSLCSSAYGGVQKYPPENEFEE